MTVPRSARNLALLLPAAAVLVYGAIRLTALAAGRPSDRAIIGKQTDGTIFVPTGQVLDPAGTNLTFEGRPVDMAMRPDGKILAVMLGSEIKLLDTSTGQFKEPALPGRHGFAGLAWSSDGRTLYSTGRAQDGAVFVTQFDEADRPTQQRPMEFGLDSHIGPNFQAKDSKPCGIALSPDNRTLYVSLFNNATLAVVDLATYNPKTGEAKYAEAPVGSSPEKVLVDRSGSKVYVANRGGRAPEAGDTRDFADPVVVDPDTYKASTGTLTVLSAEKLRTDPAHAVLKNIDVGLQPVDMALSPDGKFLYTANANAETVSVIRTDTDALVETIPTSPAPGKLAASCPNGLAVSGDGQHLYVTLGGDNAIEILDLGNNVGGATGHTRIAGLIPTQWFPLGVALGADGKSLYVANSKGIGSLGSTVARRRAAPSAMTPEAGPGGTVASDNQVGHSVYSVVGSVGIVPVPDARSLAQYTAHTARNNHFDRMQSTLRGSNDPFWKRFKHVILVIKENRTYDQVFADVPTPPGHVGGDPKLLMFGEKVTPNHHALAREFGLYDNFYCSGAISADGHHWLNEAFASDYSERGMNNYPRSYPCCGTDPLVYAGNPFLWQAAMKAGRTFFNYGEFEPLPSMKVHSSPEDNARFEVTEDRNRDVARCEHILADLKEGGRGLAQFTTVWFGNDHTSGTSPGAYTPEACVADNDLALGRLVETISHSKKYWVEEPTAIFVVEDDAQGGLDHVDGHRTVALVISPYTRRGQIFSESFNQLNMIRTIEAMLGIAPLNQFDAAALPMRNVFQNTPNFRPYDAQKNRIAVNQKNPPLNRLGRLERRWAKQSARLDFSEPDLADPKTLTEVLWHHSHGAAVFPPPTAAP